VLFRVLAAVPFGFSFVVASHVDWMLLGRPYKTDPLKLKGNPKIEVMIGRDFDVTYLAHGGAAHEKASRGGIGL
jgi:hypothetical protein